MLENVSGDFLSREQIARGYTVEKSTNDFYFEGASQSPERFVLKLLEFPVVAYGGRHDPYAEESPEASIRQYLEGFIEVQKRLDKGDQRTRVEAQEEKLGEESPKQANRRRLARQRFQINLENIKVKSDAQIERIEAEQKKLEQRAQAEKEKIERRLESNLEKLDKQIEKEKKRADAARERLRDQKTRRLWKLGK